MPEIESKIKTNKPRRLDEKILDLLEESETPISVIGLSVMLNEPTWKVRDYLKKLRSQGRIKKTCEARVSFYTVGEPKNVQLKNFHRPAKEV